MTLDEHEVNQWECPRRYQLQAADSHQQVVTINSSYLTKLKMLAYDLTDRNFKGRIFDMEEGSIVYRFPAS